MEYCIIEKSYSTELEAEVKNWQPLGGVAIVARDSGRVVAYAQAMTMTVIREAEKQCQMQPNE